MFSYYNQGKLEIKQKNIYKISKYWGIKKIKPTGQNKNLKEN